MQLVVISGRSGSGKSSALHLFEDEGFYAIDNLPVSLLPQLVEQLRTDACHNNKVAVCVDARNTTKDLSRFNEMLLALPDDVRIDVIYLDADDHTLIKRFSETRRRHPLSDEFTTLPEAIAAEKSLLEPIAMVAELNLDTRNINVHELRSTLRERVLGRDAAGLSLMFVSFGYKRGLPVDSDLVFDLRVLPNPHWDPLLRNLTGHDGAVRAFLDEKPEVTEMFNDIHGLLSKWLPQFLAGNRSYLTVSLGCTGGQHRSVYMAERLAKAFSSEFKDVQVRHRELVAPTSATLVS
jgi:RNase adapter protein RapZ